MMMHALLYVPPQFCKGHGTQQKAVQELEYAKAPVAHMKRQKILSKVQRDTTETEGIYSLDGGCVFSDPNTFCERPVAYVVHR